MKTPDITKLPKWAQDYITTLERKARNAKAELDASVVGYFEIGLA
jgi:hypothetical protein